jgi:hypothetical protein
MSTTDQLIQFPMSDEERSAALVQDLIDMEALRWRDMDRLTRKASPLARMLSRIAALLKRL